MTAAPDRPDAAGSRVISEFMPAFDVVERHETRTRAPAERAYAALRSAELLDSPLVRVLFALRRLPALGRARRPAGPSTLGALLAAGFVLLGEDPPHEIAVGLAGRFWAAKGATCDWPTPRRSAPSTRRGTPSL